MPSVANVQESVYWVGLFLYSITLLVVTFSCGYHQVKFKNQRNKWKFIFHILLIGFCILRISWYLYQGITSIYDDITALGLNRVALLLFFSAFSLVFFWQVESHSYHFGNDYALHWKYLLIYLLINFLLYLWEGIMSIIYITNYYENDGLDESSAIFIIGICEIVLYNFVLGIFFGVVGFLRFKKLKFSEDPTNKKKKLIILVQTIIFVNSYIIRAILFSIGILVSSLNPYWFAILGYWIPELVPIVVQLLIILRSDTISISAANDFRSRLYDESDNEVALIYDDTKSLTYETKTASGIQRINIPLYSTDTEESSSFW